MGEWNVFRRFHPPGKDFQDTVKKQNETKKVFNEEFIRVQR